MASLPGGTGSVQLGGPGLRAPEHTKPASTSPSHCLGIPSSLGTAGFRSVSLPRELPGCCAGVPRGVGDEIGLFSFALFYCVWGGFFILAVRVGIKDGEVPSHKP